MGTDVNTVMFSAIRAAFGDRFLNESEKSFCAEPDNLKELFQIAKKHDIAHLVAYGLAKTGAVQKNQVSDIMMPAVFRYETQNYEFTRICDALENAQIVFVSLKGSVIRSMYPEPWMRTSCDIDILVKKDNLKDAIRCLVDNLEYVEKETNEYDVSLFTPGGIHVELHFELIDECVSQKITEVLGEVWMHTSPKNGFSYWYEMSDEMFYCFHIAHMAKHFEIGGCGVRPFIDLWILDNINNVSWEKRDKLLEKGNLSKFCGRARLLSRIWLENAEYDALSIKLQNYILTGGVYGTVENKVLAQQQKKGSKLRYVLSRIFLPYSVIKLHYPILQKHRWLTPVMQVRRWFKLLFHGVSKDTVEELRQNSNISKEEADAMNILMKEIGLKN